jgi:hypothetical protein
MADLKWIWIDNPPDEESMRASLATVPAWPGSDKTLADYSDHVLPMQQWKKPDKYAPPGTKGHNEFKLYMQVAGRIKIFRDALSADPENSSFEEVVDIRFLNDGIVLIGGTLSCKFGKVQEYATGNPKVTSGADATNAIENAMTSWRGRAIAAVSGIGIIPGSGVATAEEINTVQIREEEGITTISEDGMKKFVNGEKETKKSAEPDSTIKAMVTAVERSCKARDLDFDETMQEIVPTIVEVDVKKTKIDKALLLTMDVPQLVLINKAVMAKSEPVKDAK